MLRNLLLAGAIALACGDAALAQSPRQDPTAQASATTGVMTADQVGVQPLTGVSASDYVTAAAAGDVYEIEAGQIAEDKATRRSVRALAATMIAAHKKTSATLMAALENAQRKFANPSDQLPPDKQGLIDQLKATPKGAAFDSLYLAEQLQAHQQAWALHKGYATDGDDAALRSVAATIVPVVEHHLSMIKTLQTTPDAPAHRRHRRS